MGRVWYIEIRNNEEIMNKKFLAFSTEIERRKRKAREDNDVAEEAKLCNVAGKLLAEYSKNNKRRLTTYL